MVSISSRQFMVYKNLPKKSTGKQTMNERISKHVPSLELDRSLLPYCVDPQASSARPSSVGSENRPTAMSSDGNTDDSSALRSNLSSELLEKSTSPAESEARNEASEQWVSVETAPVSAHAHCSSTTATNLLYEGEVCVTSRELEEYGGELLGPDLSPYDSGDEEGSPLKSPGVRNLFYRERMHPNGVVWESVDPEGGSPFQLSKAQRISIQDELRRVAVLSGKKARLRDRDPACAIVDVHIEERMDLHLNPNALRCYIKPDYHVVRGFHEETSCEYPNPRGSNIDDNALACTEREAAGNSIISLTEEEEFDELDAISTYNTCRTQSRMLNAKPESFPSKSDIQNHTSTGWEDPLSCNGTALIRSKQRCTNLVSVTGAKVVGSSQTFHECKTERNFEGSRKEKRKRCEEEPRTNATKVAKLKNVPPSSMFRSEHMGVCFECKGFLTAAEKVVCSRNDCDRVYHLSCAVLLPDISWSFEGKLICPQHVCYACGKNRGARLWRCQNCSLATHEYCIPCPEFTILFHNKPGWAICWRHASDVDYKLKTSTWDCQDIFRHLPVPDVQQEFNLTSEFIKEVMENDKEPPPYYFIRRNVFLIKKKRDDADDGVGCSCKSPDDVCGDDCECRVQSMSCSKDCKCSDKCSNKPFRKDKRLRVCKTTYCGWGAFAAEAIKKDEFIIEYTGEVINDAMCEKRLWEMKGRRSISNFYMCEIAKDFIIDATRKGNASRYLNHSCLPNCRLEKWRVDGETRVGVFAGRNIAAGEELNYDYKYVEFGPNVTCHCGAPNCRGAIGEKFNGNRKSNNVTAPINWGSQHKRSSLARRR